MSLEGGAACTAPSGPGREGGASCSRRDVVGGKQRSTCWRVRAIAYAGSAFGWDVRVRGRAAGAPDTEHAGVGSPSGGLPPAASGFASRMRAAGWGWAGPGCGLNEAGSSVRAAPPRLSAMHLLKGATGSARDILRGFHIQVPAREAIWSAGHALFASPSARYPDAVGVV